MAQEATRDYKFSDGTLKQYADKVVTSITRDAADFATRGVNGATLTAFQGLIDDFDGSSTDEELVGYITTATEQKDAAREIVVKHIRKVRGIADVTFQGKGLYNSFGFEDMSKLSDDDLCRMAGRVHRVATKFLTDMQADGLTQQMLTDLKAANDDFDKKMDDQVAAQENRDIETQQRILLGNKLFVEVSRLIKIGKGLYQDSDEARYNDYILPPDEGGENKTPPPTT